jgi:hypothetical protein
VADSVTKVLDNGPPGGKINIAVLGDGFAAGADQTLYNNKVQELLLDGVFAHDFYAENKQAFNVFRVNLVSTDSGVSTKTYNEHGTPSDSSDDTVSSQTTRNTALRYIFSGSWAHCWLEGGANTGSLVDAALTKWVPDHQLVVILLNNPGFGGCGGGGFAIVPLGVTWDTLAHEFGHGFGGLADEYTTSNVYSGGEPGQPNVTINRNRATLKWNRFVDPATPVPTGLGNSAGYNQGTKPATWDDNHSVGLFEGGATDQSGVFRPSLRCRMNSNVPEFCSVCYTVMKSKSDSKTGHTFLDVHAGDVTGDGRDDLVVHNGNGMQVYRSDVDRLTEARDEDVLVPGSWQFTAGDQLITADVDGDGRSEVYVFNGSNWAMPYLGILDQPAEKEWDCVARFDGQLPGWQMSKHDRIQSADLTGDGSHDLVIVNTQDWSIPYVGLYRSTGHGLQLLHRYDGSFPDWQMRSGDTIALADMSGDGKADLVVRNGSNWAYPYIGVLRHDGAGGLTMAHRYDGSMPGWQMKPGDQLRLGDLNGDGKADLVIINTSDWSMPYVGLLASNGADLTMTHRYDGSVPGWTLSRHDTFHLADIGGDGHADLWVYNSQDWSTQYLAVLRNSGGALSRSSWAADWVGQWNLGPADVLTPAALKVRGHQDQLVVHNNDWIGLISDTGGALHLDRLYDRWIHNYPYGRNW